MQRVRVNLSPYVAFCIYNVMIKLQMTHCSSILLGLSLHWVEKLERVQKKAKILCGSQKAEEWPTIADTIKRNTMMMVFKSIHYTTPEHFNDYFSRLAHSYTTRGNHSLLNLPRVKSEAGVNVLDFRGHSFLTVYHLRLETSINFKI